MALKGIRVIELPGLAPVPFCGMVLADFGATVIKIDRISTQKNQDSVSNGKKSLALNLKDPEAVKILRELCKQCDVLVEPFRPGVMERLGLGPDVLLKDNPKLVYARLNGFGQNGMYSNKAGHEINFIGQSGLLSLFGLNGSKPTIPGGVGGDFGGGGLTCAFGIVLALLERHSSGLGQVVDCSISEGSAYLGSWLYRSQTMSKLNDEFLKAILELRAHFYDTYQTKDGKYMAVGAVEPQFYANFVKGLGCTLEELPQSGNYQQLKRIVTAKFLERTQKEWCDIFDGLDACVTPVVTLQDAADHPHNVARKAFNKIGDINVPNPAPKLSRTPAASNIFKNRPEIGEHTEEILRSLNYDVETISKLAKDGVVKCIS